MLLTDPEEPNVRKYLGEEGCTLVFQSGDRSSIWPILFGTDGDVST